MAIDRGPWNALVDDDGSNTTGTLWNKDKIKTVILDPIDAAFWATATVDLTLRALWKTLEGAAMLPTIFAHRYKLLQNDLIYWEGYNYVECPAATAAIVVHNLPFSGVTIAHSPIAFNNLSRAAWGSGGSGTFEARRGDGQLWPVGGAHLSWSVVITATYIG